MLVLVSQSVGSLLAERITWVRVDRPRLDLLGIILSSISLTAFVLTLAAMAGIGLALVWIVRRRRAMNAPASAGRQGELVLIDLHTTTKDEPSPAPPRQQN
ncbi:MAG: hypothetical protein MUF51_00225 [Vicinamibacteria bacterium]|jgi:hypothetical protein|nr:hypothetical protein [Vicinamibacteria bacterium]